MKKKGNGWRKGKGEKRKWGLRRTKTLLTRIMVQKYKAARGCAGCGKKDVGVLSFHHIDPAQKEFNIGESLSKGEQRVMREIKKCVLLCKWCHRAQHVR